VSDTQSKTVSTKAKWGMEEHVTLLAEQSLPVPETNPNPTVVAQNETDLASAA